MSIRYLIGYDLNTARQSYNRLTGALQELGARRLLVSQWVLDRSGTSARDLATYLWQFLDGEDRLMVTELDGTDWYGFNLMVQAQWVMAAKAPTT